MEKSRYALITGATSGIGKAFAKELAARKVNLIITGRRQEILEKVASEIRETSGVTVEVIIAELTREEDLNLLLSRIEEVKSLEFLINNAGFGTGNFFHRETIESQLDMLKVHSEVSIRLAHSAIPGMIDNRCGNIINLASIAARTIIPSSVIYSATKSFLVTFSEALHLELARHNIRIQALCPGFTRTDFHMKMELPKNILKNKGLSRWMTPEEVVKISLKTLKKKNRVVCVPGAMNRFVFWLTDFLPRRLKYSILGSSDNLYEFFSR